jgi:UDP-glucose 4-epimerase
MVSQLDPSRKVVVTGAAGTVGRAVVGRLLAGGWSVRGVDVRAPQEEISGDLELEIGDLTDPRFAHRCVRDAGAVIHTAALVDISLGYEALRPLNVDAVRVLYRGAARAGARRFVHFSSGSIYGTDGRGPLREEMVLAPSSPYELTKIESERMLEEVGRDEELEWIVLRPGLVYGPGARFLLADLAAVPPLLRAVLGDNVPALAGGPRTNVVHAEDVARAAVFLMLGAAPYRAYNVADPTPLDMGSIVTAVIRAYGLEPRFTIPLPEPGSLRPLRPVLDSDVFFRAANAPVLPLWRELVEEHALVDALSPALDRESAPYLFRDSVFSVERLAVRGFTWKHPDFREHIGDVLRWYEDNRWIPTVDEVAPGRKRLPRMGFRFTETMAGEVRLRDDAVRAGPGRPFVFTVTARARRIERFLRTWETDLDGVLRWPGVADGAAVRGTLWMPLLSRRVLVYDFSFRGDDGRRLRFVGRKDVRLSRLLATMTRLPGRVLDDEDNEVARGVARFDLGRELLPMVRSFGIE